MAVVDVVLVLLQESVHLHHREWVEAAQGIAFLRSVGANVEGALVRTSHQVEQVAARLVDRPPRLAIIVVEKRQSASALSLLNQLRSLSPQCTVALAGAEATLSAHDFTSHTICQAILLGEWVEAAAELYLANKRHQPGNKVAGVWWRTDKGWVLGERRVYDPKLASWPTPSTSDLKGADIARLLGGALPLLASRGFPFRTLFSPEPFIRELHEATSYYHPRPVERVVEEAAELARVYGLQRLIFTDDIFPWEMSWTVRFAELWQRQVRLPFSIRTISEHLDSNRLRALVAAGLKRLELRLESGNEGLRRTHSDVNVSNVQIRESLERCRELGIETSLRLMVGSPGETTKTLESTMAFSKMAGASHVRGEIYHHWPIHADWAQLEMEMTGGTSLRAAPVDRPEIQRDAALALHEIQKIDALSHALRARRREDVVLDGLPDIASARVRSPLEGCFQVERYHTTTGSELVIALRVPCELSWQVKVPRDPILQFGMLLQPALPGERSRLPISFSVRVSQGGRSFRLFQKVLIQALDPDSRHWHWFRLPVTNVKPGWVDFTFDNLIYGQDASSIPPGRDAWAGWARITVQRPGTESVDQSTDHELRGGRFNDLGAFFEEE